MYLLRLFGYYFKKAVSNVYDYLYSINNWILSCAGIPENTVITPYVFLVEVVIGIGFAYFICVPVAVLLNGTVPWEWDFAELVKCFVRSGIESVNRFSEINHSSDSASNSSIIPDPNFIESTDLCEELDFEFSAMHKANFGSNLNTGVSSELGSSPTSKAEEGNSSRIYALGCLVLAGLVIILVTSHK